MSVKATHWCITWNNPPTDFWDNLITWPKLNYATGCIEHGKNGTAHLQGYIEFKSQVRLSHIKKCCKFLHAEPRRGTQQQAIDYCLKSGNDPYVYGTPNRPGKRNDLLHLYDQVACGKRDLEILEDDPELYGRNYKIVDKFRSVLLDKEPHTPPIVSSIIGPSGIGKTRYVFDMYGSDQIYNLCDSKNGMVWFDGYTNQPVLLIDDFDGWIPYRFFLKLIDRYPINGQVKGSMRPLKFKHIYITSNDQVSTWYPGTDPTPINRRIAHQVVI